MTCFPHIYAYGQQKKQQFSEAEVLLFYCLRVHFRQPGGGDADKKLDRLREKTQLMSVLKRAQTAQRQLNTFVVIPVDISVEFLNKIIQGNARP